MQFVRGGVLLPGRFHKDGVVSALPATPAPALLRRHYVPPRDVAVPRVDLVPQATGTWRWVISLRTFADVLANVDASTCCSVQTSACTGACAAGYFCPAGSTTPTAFVCGNANRYCPAGSGLPLTVPAGTYSLPVDGDPTVRTGVASCPPDRACVSGVLLPTVNMTTSCPNGVLDGAMEEMVTNLDVGPGLTVSSPGYSGAMIWEIVSLAAADSPNCTANTSMFSVPGGDRTASIRVGSVPVQFSECPRVNITVSVRRAVGPTDVVQCNVRLSVRQVTRKPVMIDCGPRVVNERSAEGTLVGAPLVAENPNTGTALLWFINATNVPFTIGMCDAQLRVRRVFSWTEASSYTFPLIIRNDGSALGIASTSTTCNVTVHVNLQPRPPTPTTTSFSVNELSSVGTVVGNIGATDPGGFAVTSVSFSQVDVPNAFSIDNSGLITVAQVVDILIVLKTTFAYSVNVSNAFSSGIYPIVITVNPVTRPPQTFAQVRSVLENATPGTTLAPPLAATHPQGLSFTFSMDTVTNTNFDVTPSGTVFVLPSASLNFHSVPSHLVPFTVTDSAGRSASAVLTVNLIEVNKPPVFCCNATFEYAVDEFAPANALLPASMPAGASDINSRDTLTYRITGSNPPLGQQIFAIDPLTGDLRVGPAVAATGGVLRYNELAAYPAPFTVILNLTVADSGVPSMSANGSAKVVIRNIRPRISIPAPNATPMFPGNASVGFVLFNASAFTWSAYDRSRLVYSLVAEPCDNNDPSFVIDPVTGMITVPNVMYTGLQSGPPRWNFNVKSSFIVNVTVTDSITGLAATTDLRAMMGHTNRPPTWLGVPRMFAVNQQRGSVGMPLLSYVSDPDIPLGVGESFTFSIVGGNTGSTFNISEASGQIAADNIAAPTFNTVGYIYNLTVRVTDAGVNGPRFSANVTVQIEVAYTNRPPVVNYANLTVNEFAPVDTLVGFVTGSDPDSGQTLRYFIAPFGPNINRPFPFNVTTEPTGNGASTRGRITVINDGPIDWNQLFKRYQVLVTAVDSDATTPLSASTVCDIYVNWVAQPPYFNPSKVPSSAVFTVAVDEHSPAGRNVSTTPITALHKDPWQRPQLRYEWANPAAPGASLFTVDSVTGIITVSSTAGDIQFNARSNYTLTLRVRDGLGLTDTASVVIQINDVNDPAVFTGLLSPNRTPAAQLSVSEGAPVGTIVGFVTASEVDRSPIWGARNFGVLPLWGSRFFSVNATSGAIVVAAMGMDYWNEVAHVLNVTCTDSDPLSPITVQTPVSVTVLQANTVRVFGFWVPPGANPEVAVNTSSAGSQDALPQALFATTGAPSPSGGGPGVMMFGRGFGRTAERLASLGIGPSTTVVTAKFGPTGTEYTAVNCSVAVPNTAIICGVPAGMGTNHRWTVTVREQAGATPWSAVSVGRTGYLRPTITGVSKEGAVGNADPAAHQITTRGGDVIVVDGINLGPVGTEVVLAYGPRGATVLPYLTSPCLWVTAHTRVRCRSVAGVGANLTFQVIASSQSSPIFNSSLVRYATPTIARVAAPLLRTDGRQTNAIVINGSDFGPAGTSAIEVQYSADFADASYPVWTARNCFVSVAHAAIVCTPSEGIGTSLRARIAIAGQMSTASVDSVSYTPPTITGIAGRGADLAVTEGGQTVEITGEDFGPATPLDAAGFPLPGRLQPAAMYGRYDANAAAANLPLRYTAQTCRVAVAHAVIICSTTAGTGRDLFWRVQVGEQRSAVFWNRSTSYAPPVVAGYDGDGVARADTAGGQTVQISGKNFGPAGTVIDSVTYGMNGTEFLATGCALVDPHRLINCSTVVGAGAGLRWFVTIDGQRSVSPSTSYGAPVITGFIGPGATDANTDGGDSITILGQFFSIQQHLEAVTYGPGGTEFSAQQCVVTQNHTAITCAMQPGVGRNLRWRVKVGGQVSTDNGITTSYASPNITSIAPIEGPTPGGVDVVIRGSNFGLNHSATDVVVRVNNVGTPGVARPPISSINAYWNALRAGMVPPNNGVGAWLEGMALLLPSSKRIISRGVHELVVTLPEGFGVNRDVLVLVNGVPSNIATFTYSAPSIVNVAPDRQNVSLGYLRVFVEGVNFCNGMLDCGTVTVDGQGVLVRSWTHTSVMFVMPDPAAADEDPEVQITVAGVASNSYAFRKPVPNINALVVQNEWTNRDTLGNEVFFIRGVLDIGLEPVTITIGGRECTGNNRTVDNGKLETEAGASFLIRCWSPAGVGSNLPVVITSLGGSSRVEGAPSYSYAPPLLRDVSLARMVADTNGTGNLGRRLRHATPRRLALPDGIPTLGADVIVEGRYFGSPALGSVTLTVDTIDIAQVISWNDTVMTARIPPGDGSGHFLRARVETQDSNDLPFRFASPSLSAVTPNHGPTVGGTRITINGTNFGISEPTVTLGGRTCELVQPFVPSAGHDSIVCVSPPGQGIMQNLIVRVSGQASPAASFPVVFNYDPPQVFAVWPTGGPTSGRLLGPLLPDGVRRAQGARINMTLHGSNLGSRGRLEFRPHAGSNFLTRLVVVPDADIQFWNDTYVEFFMPAGYGDSLTVTAIVGNQTSTNFVEFIYNPPRVVAVTRADRSPEECAPRSLCFEFANVTRCRSTPADCYPTRGGFPLEIIGESLGENGAVVTIGGRPCALSGDFAQSHESIVCTVPTGLGDRNRVLVNVGGRMSGNETAAWFAYDPPILSHIMPNTPDARSEPVTFRGKNFGFEPMPVVIHIGGLPCRDAEWVNDAQVRCNPSADTVGAKNISILAANRTTTYDVFETEEMYVALCKPGFYGMEQELCLPCPQGATCPGAERRVDLLRANAFYWRANVTTPTALCPVERHGRPACPVLLPCEPAVACTGNNTCADGYTGERCSQCLKGTYHRVNGECVRCPDSPVAVFVGFAILVLAAISIAYVLNKRNVSIALISIGVDYFQVLSMFTRTQVRWPRFIREILQYLSAFNLNLEIVAPDCLVPTVEYWQKWFFIEALPLCAIVIFVAMHVLKLGYKLACLNKKKKQLNAHVPTMVSTGIVIFRILYLYLTRTSLDVMNCAPTVPPERDASGNVIEYMNGMLDYPCFRSGSMQVFLFPFALGTLLTYSFALPLAALWWLNKNKESIKYDQILRAKVRKLCAAAAPSLPKFAVIAWSVQGTGTDPLSNPYYRFRKMWSKLYYHFRPGKWYWELLITARKFCIAFVSLMFRSTPSYQMAACLLVLFAAYVLHMRHLPYMSHAQRSETIKEHERKVLEGDELHVRIQDGMRTVAKRNMRDRSSAKQVFEFDPVARRRGSVVDRVVLSFFDYNTVEGVMLVFAILVNIAGIMFDSNRFQGELAAVYEGEYERLGGLTAAVIFISIVYYILVVIMDLLVIFAPRSANSCFFAITTVWNAALVVILGPFGYCIVKKQKARPPKRSVELRRMSRRASMGTGLSVNPLMLKETADADVSAIMSDSGIIDPTAVSTLQGAPTPAMWQVVQGSYVRLHGMVEQLRTQLRDAKREQERGKAAGKLQAYAGPLHRTRTQFKPVVRHDQTGAQSNIAAGGGHGVAVGDHERDGLEEAQTAILLASPDGTPAADTDGARALRVSRGGQRASPVRRASSSPASGAFGSPPASSRRPSTAAPAGMPSGITLANPLRRPSVATSRRTSVVLRTPQGSPEFM